MAKMTALKMGQLIKDHEITVRQVIDQTLDQINEKSNLNAYITIADNLEAQIEEVQAGLFNGQYKGSLAGVPVALKDNICTKDMRTTCASKMLEHFQSPYDAFVVKCLKEAGAIIIGKTNMDEFGMGNTTKTSYAGVVKNPWNQNYNAGGSSGGSAAVVAAGLASFALGSDTGGSIRQPSAHCGVVGLKPTYGSVSRNGLIAYASSFDQIGPITQNVLDCAAVLDLIVADDQGDGTSIKRKPEYFREELKHMNHKPKVGVPIEYIEAIMDEEVRQAIDVAVELLKSHGVDIEYFHMNLLDYLVPTYYTIASAEASSNLSRYDGIKYGYQSPTGKTYHDVYKQSRAEGFGQEVKRRVMLGTFVLSSGYYEAYYLKALKVRSLIQTEFNNAFKQYDIILGPTTPKKASVISDVEDLIANYTNDMYTVSANLLGLPAMSIPCQIGKENLPIGLQLIGKPFREIDILRLGYLYEQIRGEVAGDDDV